MTISTRQASVIAEGSDNFQWKSPAATIAAGASVTVRISEEFPRARLFEPLDSIQVINNSGVLVEVSFNSPADVYTVPAYMIWPKARKSFRQFTIKNLDSVTAIAEDEVIVNVRRLPPNIQLVANA